MVREGGAGEGISLPGGARKVGSALIIGNSIRKVMAVLLLESIVPEWLQFALATCTCAVCARRSTRTHNFTHNVESILCVGVQGQLSTQVSIQDIALDLTLADHVHHTGKTLAPTLHDPSIIKEGNSWYVFSTGQGIQVLKSDNGTNFYRVPQIFLTAPSWWKTYVPNQTPLDVWAPDAKQYNGKTWLYYSISTFGK